MFLELSVNTHLFSPLSLMRYQEMVSTFTGPAVGWEPPSFGVGGNKVAVAVSCCSTDLSTHLCVHSRSGTGFWTALGYNLHHRNDQRKTHTETHIYTYIACLQWLPYVFIYLCLHVCVWQESGTKRQFAYSIAVYFYTISICIFTCALRDDIYND